ncbi:MAG: ArsR/SmtB family transcription factor [Gemmatimonadota bacterium]
MEANLAPQLDVALVADSAGLTALGNPARRRILAALAGSPDSASGLAERLDDTRQRVNYHVRALEDAGLVELVEERPRRGLTEKIYRAAGCGFAVDPAVLGSLDAGEALAEGDRWAAGYAIALASRITREIASLRRRASRERKRLAVASLDTTVRLRTPKAMEAFVDDLARTIAEVVARHDDASPKARPFRLVSCSHPAPDPASPTRETPGGTDNPEE